MKIILIVTILTMLFAKERLGINKIKYKSHIKITHIKMRYNPTTDLNFSLKRMEMIEN